LNDRDRFIPSLHPKMVKGVVAPNRFLHWGFILILITACTALQTSCRVGYSFTGASISPDVKTISIQYFTNNAPLVVPTMSRTITDRMKDYFSTQTSLTLVDRNGDLHIEGAITDYSVRPMAIQGNETAAMNRISITINVKFTNRKNEKQNFDNMNFTRYQDYSSSLSLSSVQDNLILEITDQLVQDVFNKAVVNW
jgi:hypothetical protein